MELFYTLSTSIQVEQVLSFNHELLILYYIAPAALFAIPHKMLLARSLVSYPLPSPSLSCFQNYFLSSLYSVCYLTIKCPLSLSPKTAFSQTSLLCSLVKKENSNCQPFSCSLTAYHRGLPFTPLYSPTKCSYLFP